MTRLHADRLRGDHRSSPRAARLPAATSRMKMAAVAGAAALLATLLIAPRMGSAAAAQDAPAPPVNGMRPAELHAYAITNASSRTKHKHGVTKSRTHFRRTANPSNRRFRRTLNSDHGWRIGYVVLHQRWQ